MAIYNKTVWDRVFKTLSTHFINTLLFFTENQVGNFWNCHKMFSTHSHSLTSICRSQEHLWLQRLSFSKWKERCTYTCVSVCKYLCVVSVFVFDHTMCRCIVSVCVCVCVCLFLLLLERCRLVRKSPCSQELSDSSPHRQSFVSLRPLSPALCNWLAFLPWHREPSAWMSPGSRTNQTLRSSQGQSAHKDPWLHLSCIFPRQSCLGNTSMGSKHLPGSIWALMLCCFTAHCP